MPRISRTTPRVAPAAEVQALPARPADATDAGTARRPATAAGRARLRNGMPGLPALRLPSNQATRIRVAEAALYTGMSAAFGAVIMGLVPLARMETTRGATGHEAEFEVEGAAGGALAVLSMVLLATACGIHPRPQQEHADDIISPTDMLPSTEPPSPALSTGPRQQHVLDFTDAAAEPGPADAAAPAPDIENPAPPAARPGNA